ncbi:MAG: hypothetical protein QXD03_05010 [Candidatus Anstonellales archaeon]
MRNIEKLDVLPERVRTDDGYFYPEEYVDKMFLYGNDVVFITRSAIYQFPYIIFLKFFEHSYNEMKDMVIEESANKIIEIASSEIYEKVVTEISENLVSEVNERHLEDVKNILINEAMSKFDSKLEELRDYVSEFVIETIKEYFNNNKQELVDMIVESVSNDLMKKLDSKYEQIINEKILKLESILRKEKEESKKDEKMTLSQLMALKEMFTAEEIIKMREAGIL